MARHTLRREGRQGDRRRGSIRCHTEAPLLHNGTSSNNNMRNTTRTARPSQLGISSSRSSSNMANSTLLRRRLRQDATSNTSPKPTSRLAARKFTEVGHGTTPMPRQLPTCAHSY